MSKSSDNIESVSVVLFDNRKNTVFKVFYRQPKGQKIKPFGKTLKENFSNQFHAAGNFNLNVLDCEICKNLQKILTYNL